MSIAAWRRLTDSLLPWLAILCLLGAQQAAYAHALGHMAPARAGVAQLDGVDGRAPGVDIVATCTSCAAFSALDAAAPLSSPAAIAAGVPPASPPAAAQSQAHAAVSHYLARAPPVRL